MLRWAERCVTVPLRGPGKDQEQDATANSTAQLESTSQSNSARIVEVGTIGTSHPRSELLTHPLCFSLELLPFLTAAVSQPPEKGGVGLCFTQSTGGSKSGSFIHWGPPSQEWETRCDLCLALGTSMVGMQPGSDQGGRRKDGEDGALGASQRDIQWSIPS